MAQYDVLAPSACLTIRVYTFVRHEPYGAVTPWRLGQPTPFPFIWETLVSVHGRFHIARHALLTLLGCRRTPRHAGAEKVFEHAQLFPRSNVWATFEQNVHRSLYKRYEIVHFVRLSLFMRLVCVRKVKRWQSFVIYLACYQRVIGSVHRTIV